MLDALFTCYHVFHALHTTLMCRMAETNPLSFRIGSRTVKPASIDWIGPWNSESDRATWCYILSCTPMFWWPKLKITFFPKTSANALSNALLIIRIGLREPYDQFTNSLRIFDLGSKKFVLHFQVYWYIPKTKVANRIFSENFSENPLEWAADHQNRTTGTVRSIRSGFGYRNPRVYRGLAQPV